MNLFSALFQIYFTIKCIISCGSIYLLIFHFLVKILAGLPRTERGKPISIHGDPKGKTFLYCNGNSIFIRNIEVIFNINILEIIAFEYPPFIWVKDICESLCLPESEAYLIQCETSLVEFYYINN